MATKRMWEAYEAYKRWLQALNLTPEEYERKIEEFWGEMDAKQERRRERRGFMGR